MYIVPSISCNINNTYYVFRDDFTELKFKIIDNVIYCDYALTDAEIEAVKKKFLKIPLKKKPLKRKMKRFALKKKPVELKKAEKVTKNINKMGCWYYPNLK